VLAQVGDEFFFSSVCLAVPLLPGVEAGGDH
jgi:hypothetical protein